MVTLASSIYLRFTLIFISATGADYDPFLNPLMSEWTQACYLCDVNRIRDMLETEGTILLNRR